MRAVVLDRFGGPDVLRLADLPVPQPGNGEIQIQVAYTAVNPVDWKIREGWLKDVLPHRFPLIPGFDVAGLVTALGPKTSRFKVGDKVYAYGHKPEVQWGTYAEFVTLKEELTAPMPNTIGFKDAAAIPLSGLTAWQALFEKARIQLGETVLIHAGAGGVGSYAVQFAAKTGARVFTTASLRNHSLLQQLGADTVIDYAREDFVIILQSEGGADVVLDLLGGETLQKSFAALKKGGRLVSTVEAPAAQTAAEFGVSVFEVLTQPKAGQLLDIARWVEDGRLQIPPLREYDLKDAPAAQSLSQTGHIQGKIVLKVK